MSRHIFTGGNGITGETGLVVRNGLNNNFGELYAAKHIRQHAMDSALDHADSPINKGKFVKANDVSGAMEFAFIVDSDIPSTIARASDLQNHIDDTENPHNVTAEQLGITVVEYTGGDGIDITGAVISTRLAAGGGLEYDEAGALKATGGSVSRYQACATSGKEVWVVASGIGVTGAWANGNDLTLTIPAGVVVMGISIYLSTYASMTITITGDVTSPGAHKWFPMCQAWRDDTQNQLTGVTLQGTAGNDFKFTINGLINTTNNFIRLTL